MSASFSSCIKFTLALGIIIQGKMWTRYSGWRILKKLGHRFLKTLCVTMTILSCPIVISVIFCLLFFVFSLNDSTEYFLKHRVLFGPLLREAAIADKINETVSRIQAKLDRTRNFNIVFWQFLTTSTRIFFLKGRLGTKLCLEPFLGFSHFQICSDP